MGSARRIVLGGMATAAAAAAVLAAPRVLPALPGFDVRRVEVSGTRLLAPDDVVRSSGIRQGQSVWEEATQWEAALERHAVIESARVTRRLPGTLRVQVEEKQPVAYLAEPVLAPVTASGERLPVDPTRSAADLPIVRSEADAVPPVLLAEAERLARIDPALIVEVSEIRAFDKEGSVLVLRHREADIVIPAGAPTERLVELRAVLADLDERVGPGGAGGVVRVDLRYADQIVVRLPPSVQKP